MILLFSENKLPPPSTARYVLLITLFLFVWLLPLFSGIALPKGILSGMVILAFVATFWAGKGKKPPDNKDLTRQLLVDIAFLAALVFFSGGVTNPLISLLLLPVALAATALAAREAALISLVAVIAYALLTVFYLPLAIPNASQATQLHLIGMWLTFAISALIISVFIQRMRSKMAAQNAELSRARENALRNEQVTALGTLAAGAAHALGTPLNTLNLIIGEWQHDKPFSPALQEDIDLMHREILRCKAIISSLSCRAIAGESQKEPTEDAAVFLQKSLENWQNIHPKTSISLQVITTGEKPKLFADQRLEQALMNLFDNAENAGATDIHLQLFWNEETIEIHVLDNGTGFSPEVLKTGGQCRLPATSNHLGTTGLGLGLLLTSTAIKQLGGDLLLYNREEGGAALKILLPRL